MNNTLDRLTLVAACLTIVAGARAQPTGFTHGPILGQPDARSLGVWARTAGPTTFRVVYGTDPNRLNQRSLPAITTLDHDNTGVAQLTGLTPHTRYFYKVVTRDGAEGPGGTFRTMHDTTDLVDAETNPRGLFNFSFEFGCGNNQAVLEGDRAVQPTFETMNREVAQDIDFAILNGDFIYETDRVVGAEAWRRRWGVGRADTPRIVRLAPTITGVWQNYKTYLRRGHDLSVWHRNVPSFFTLDDHELLNDLYGAGTPGFKNRKAAFRDTGMRAWFDYLGWSNPQANTADAHFGAATLKAGSDVLTDPDADFTEMDLDQMSNLLVHWGGDSAGDKLSPSAEYPGLPNAGVYGITGVIDPHRLRITPAAEADSESVYSVGRLNYGKRTVANCDVFFLDSRSYRDVRDVNNPAQPGVSMLGKKQRDWLVAEMSASDAEFFFVVSSVNFMVPHTTPGRRVGEALTKGEAWTVYLDERERLIDFWDRLNKPVMLLTGDLHNSFAIQITDNLWEFASGPHTSGNHTISSEGHHPASGVFRYGPRDCDILWSTYVRDDVPRAQRRMPHYCVVQVNNVFNNPTAPGQDRYVAFEHPQVIVQYYDGLTGKLKYAQAISTPR